MGCQKVNWIFLKCLLNENKNESYFVKNPVGWGAKEWTFSSKFLEAEQTYHQIITSKYNIKLSKIENKHKVTASVLLYPF